MIRKKIGVGFALAFAGATFGMPACSGDDSFATQTNGTSDAQVLTDATVIADVVTYPVSTNDACSGGPLCFDASSVLSFSTPPLPPVANQGKCANDDVIEQFLFACAYDVDVDAGIDSCVAYTEANPDCALCLGGLVPPDAGPAAPLPWPAVIFPDSNGRTIPNLGACIAAISMGTDTCKSNYTNDMLCAATGCGSCAPSDQSACVLSQTSGYGCPDNTCVQAYPTDLRCLTAISDASSTDGETKCGYGDPISTFGEMNFVFMKVAKTLCETN